MHLLRRIAAYPPSVYGRPDLAARLKANFRTFERMAFPHRGDGLVEHGLGNWGCGQYKMQTDAIVIRYIWGYLRKSTPNFGVFHLVYFEHHTIEMENRVELTCYIGVPR